MRSKNALVNVGMVLLGVALLIEGMFTIDTVKVVEVTVATVNSISALRIRYDWT